MDANGTRGHGLCFRVLKRRSKSRCDSYSVRNSVLIISHIAFRNCRVHFFSDNLSRNSCMLWSNFILGLNYLFFCFKLIIIHYHTQKQKKRKFKPKIILNYNIYNIIKQQFVVMYWETNSQNFVLLPISSQEVE